MKILGIDERGAIIQSNTGRGCKLCGGSYGNCGELSKCLACGSVQCTTNGLGNGSCAFCLYGILWSYDLRTHSYGSSASWSGGNRDCAYAGCQEQAIVVRAPRKGYFCRGHLKSRVPTVYETVLAAEQRYMRAVSAQQLAWVPDRGTHS